VETLLHVVTLHVFPEAAWVQAGGVLAAGFVSRWGLRLMILGFGTAVILAYAYPVLFPLIFFRLFRVMDGLGGLFVILTEVLVRRRHDARVVAGWLAGCG
jgi:hypothetical protein